MAQGLKGGDFEEGTHLSFVDRRSRGFFVFRPRTGSQVVDG
jgi:hypothetical protein